MNNESRRKTSLLVLCLVLKLKIRRQRRMRRFWIRPSLQDKRLAADMLNLAKLDDDGMDGNELIQWRYFRSFTRMPIEIFKMLAIKVELYIEKKKN